MLTPSYTDPAVTLYQGDALTVLRSLPAEAVQVCVTSPPYWGLRDYGVPGQIGLEPTPEAYVAALVEVFREVRRVLKADGTVWLNLGDTFAANRSCQGGMRVPLGYKAKDLVGIPWQVAFALRADGWWLRSDVVWHKPNCLPESVTDRPVRSHEYLFLLSKSARYYYDHLAVQEPLSPASLQRLAQPTFEQQQGGAKDTRGNRSHRKTVENLRRRASGNKARKLEVPSRPTDHRGSSIPWEGSMRNKRDVWTVPVVPFSGAHFATYPPALVEPCLLAGSRPGDVVLDPFHGAGTTGMVAQQLGRRYIGIELNPDYLVLSLDRLRQPGLPLPDAEPGGKILTEQSEGQADATHVG